MSLRGWFLRRPSDRDGLADPLLNNVRRGNYAIFLYYLQAIRTPGMFLSQPGMTTMASR